MNQLPIVVRHFGEIGSYRVFQRLYHGSFIRVIQRHGIGFQKERRFFRQQSRADSQVGGAFFLDLGEELFHRIIAAGVVGDESTVIRAAILVVAQSPVVTAASHQLRETGGNILISRNDMLGNGGLIPLAVVRFIPVRYPFHLIKPVVEGCNQKVVVGMQGEHLAALNDFSAAVVRHEEPGVRLFLFVSQNLVKVGVHLGQQRQIVLHVLCGMEAVFCKEDRKLGCGTTGRCQDFVEKRIVRQGQLAVQIIREHIVDNLLILRQRPIGKVVQLLAQLLCGKKTAFAAFRRVIAEGYIIIGNACGGGVA